KNGQEIASAEDAIRLTRKMLAEGKILAIKGLGGFHLACDAQNENALAQLRLRKRRSGKPFALMSYDIKIIRQFADVSKQEEELLSSTQSPIVVLNLTKRGHNLAKTVAPDQNTLGFM